MDQDHNRIGEAVSRVLFTPSYIEELPLFICPHFLIEACSSFLRQFLPSVSTALISSWGPWSSFLVLLFACNNRLPFLSTNQLSFFYRVANSLKELFLEFHAVFYSTIRIFVPSILPFSRKNVIITLNFRWKNKFCILSIIL